MYSEHRETRDSLYTLWQSCTFLSWVGGGGGGGGRGVEYLKKKHINTVEPEIFERFNFAER